MPSSNASYFGVIDYLMVSGTLIVSLGIGVYHAFQGGGSESSDDLLLGGRSMKPLPIAASMLVTYFSATAIVGLPAEIYANGIQTFWMDFLLTFACIPLATYLFVTVLYKMKLTSAYEYLELRFDSLIVRAIASLLFILEVTFMTALALFAPSIVLEQFLGLPQWLSIIGIGICGTIYTSIGGLKAVVWTDVFQFFLISIGMVAIVISGFLAVGSIGEVFQRANDHGRLQLFNWNIDPFERYNTFNFVLGYGIVIICFFGTHQPNVQRYSSLPSLKDAVIAMAWNALFKELTFVLIILTGISIFAVYSECDLIRIGEIKTVDEIVPYFFVNEVSKIPGMIGLFTSCIFSAVLSTLSSSLNSLAAVTWEDFLCKISFFASLSDVTKGRITCLLSALYGILTMALAFIAGQLGSIFQVSITIIGAFGGALGGAFIMGIFIPCVNKIGVSVGMIVGLLSTACLTCIAHLLNIPHKTLPTSVAGCPINTTISKVNIEILEDLKWPTKIFSLSYILYPFIGVLVSVTIGIILSLATNPYLKPNPNVRQYLHPFIKKLCQRSSLKPTSPSMELQGVGEVSNNNVKY